MRTKEASEKVSSDAHPEKGVKQMSLYPLFQKGYKGLIKIKKKRVKAGTKALKEIKQLQKSTDLIIPKASFRRLLKELVRDRHNNKNNDMNITDATANALQESAEAYLVEVLSGANDMCIHSNRKTISKEDMRSYIELKKAFNK
jgi:histone H3/H4